MLRVTLARSYLLRPRPQPGPCEKFGKSVCAAPCEKRCREFYIGEVVSETSECYLMESRLFFVSLPFSFFSFPSSIDDTSEVVVSFLRIGEERRNHGNLLILIHGNCNCSIHSLYHANWIFFENEDSLKNYHDSYSCTYQLFKIGRGIFFIIPS